MSLLPLYASGGLGSTATDGLAIGLDLDRSPFGDTTERVARAFRRLTGLFGPEDPERPLPLTEFHDYAQHCYSTIRADGTEVELLSYLAYLSTFFHEARHAHDLMGTFYGQELLHINLNCSQNLPSLVVALEAWQAAERGRTIPLPLRSKSEPVRAEADLARLFAYYERMSDQVAEFDRPADASPAQLTITHLLEASAINVQFGFIADTFDDDATFRLLEFVQSGQRASLYLQVREEVTSEFSRRDRTGEGWERLVNCLLWCALNRPSFPDGPLSEAPNPVIFYEAAAEEVAAEVDQPDVARAMEVISRFCGEWKLTDPRGAVERRRGEMAQRLRRLSDMLSQYSFSEPFVALHRGHVAAYERLTKCIFAEPENYFSSYRYVADVLLGRLPEVFILLKWRDVVRAFRLGSPRMFEESEWDMKIRTAAATRILLHGRGSVRPAFIEDSDGRCCSETRARSSGFETSCSARRSPGRQHGADSAGLQLNFEVACSPGGNRFMMRLLPHSPFRFLLVECEWSSAQEANSICNVEPGRIKRKLGAPQRRCAEPTTDFGEGSKCGGMNRLWSRIRG